MHKGFRAIKAALGLLNPKTWGPFLDAYEVTHFDSAFSVHWSQGGEDVALLATLDVAKGGTYLDIGAHHPNRFSVTRHLYQKGWHGVNVEANAELISIFDELRKRDKNICACVGSADSYSFSVFEEPGISTTDIHWREKFVSEGNKILRTIEIQGRTLRSLLDENFPEHGPDLLNIDVEGADLDVVKSGDFATLSPARLPKWILLETSPPLRSALDTPAVKELISIGYTPWLVLTMATLLRRPE